jgi:hypothetical protein
MKSKLINDGPQKTYVLVLDKGDEAVSSIESFVRKNGISAAQLTGIGAFSDTVLGFFDWETPRSGVARQSQPHHCRAGSRAPRPSSPLTKSLRHDSFALNSGTDSDGIGSAA